MNVFVGEDITSDDKVVTLYSAVVWSVGLKRKVKVVIVDGLEPGKKTQERKVFFSTDTSMSAKDIMDIYRTRFQIEYLLPRCKAVYRTRPLPVKEEGVAGLCFQHVPLLHQRRKGICTELRCASFSL